MTTYSFESTPKDIEHVINRLADNPHLNEWEKNFISNIKYYYVHEHGFLSDKQMQTLSNLWENY